MSLLTAAGIDYQLFDHQVEAIREARDGKTVVVAAGTGSGKTEAFLIPIIDRLIRDEAEGRDNLQDPGVRALIVYPLNALVNNQIDRLLGLLGAQTQITFAYYTSRLRNTHDEAKRYYEGHLRRPLPPPCQLIDRATLRGLDGGAGRPSGPPHILVTNFSMLEYMLIRPVDRTVFSSNHLFFRGTPRLKMVVLDEAHVYLGAQAAEMHMLLRRAADRFGTNLADLQGFATSATLSAGVVNGSSDLLEYARKMFAKPARHVAIVEGFRHLPDVTALHNSDSSLQSPEKLPDGDLVAGALRTLELDALGRPRSLRVDPEVARLAIQAVVTLGIATAAEVEALSDIERSTPALLLYALYRSHPKLMKLREWLFFAERYPTLDEAATFLYGEGESSESRRRACEAVLRLGALARNAPDKLPLIPVRMHAFLRAPLGVQVDPRPSTDVTEPEWPWGKLHLLPAPESEDHPRFPLLVCSTCGAAYLDVFKSGDDDYLPPASAAGGTHALFASSTGDHRLPEALGGGPVYEAVVRDTDRHGNRVVEACIQCGTPRARLRALYMSPRLALSALVDSVYPHLGEMPATAAAGSPVMPGGGRRLVTFSDSRQEAARIAAQVERSHDIGLNRAMLLRVLTRQGKGTALSIQTLLRDLEDDPLLRQRALAHELTDVDSREDLAKLSLYEEFARPPAGRQNTLETLGLVEVIYPDLPARPPQVSSLTDDEWRTFLATVLDLARSAGCVMKPSFDSEQAKANDVEELLPFIGKSLVQISQAPEEFEDDADETGDFEIKPVALIAKKDQSRSRFMTYATRIAAKAETSPEELLKQAFVSLDGKLETGCKWLKRGGVEGSLQVRLEHLHLRRHSAPPLISPVSGEVFFRAVRGQVHSRAEAREVRQPTEFEASDWRKRHAVQRVLDDMQTGLWAVEHTAQIDVDSLEEEESNFRGGRRNLLASSTTMEMGVDIGGLTLVVLTNVPPGPANYWQRAGRAGRRADGTSMTITLALVSAHDQLVFAAPRDFLHAPIAPPRVRLDASPLLLRHICAYLLSQFFNEVVAQAAGGNPMRSFGTVEEFVVLPAVDGVLPAKAKELDIAAQDPLWVGFSRWLGALNDTSGLAERVAALCKGTVLEGNELAQLAAETAGLLEKAVEEIQHDLKVLAEQKEEEEKKGDGRKDEQLLRALDYQESALLSETLVAYLASKAFLPRFGFPLDVVRLNTKWRINGQRAKRADEPLPALRMERSLDLALAEYAPGDEVIAGKRVFRSSGLERNWFSTDEAMSRRFFLECVLCRHLVDGYVRLESCPVCRHPAIPEEEFLERREEDTRRRRHRRGRAADATAQAADPSLRPPSVVRQYLRPAGFAVKLLRPPRRVSGEIARVGPTYSSITLSTAKRRTEAISGALAISFSPESRVFVRSEGKPDNSGRRGFGFLICRVCGFAHPEADWGSAVPREFSKHYALRGKGRCPGQTSFWRHAVLGTSLPVDALSLELSGEMEPRMNPSDLDAFHVTLAAVAQLAASRCLQVDLRTLASGVAPRQTPSGFAFDTVVYESAASGLLRQLAEDPGPFIHELRRLLESENDADFVRFDTQFLREKLRPDLVKAHFGAEHRKTLLEVPIESEGVRILRGRGPRLAAIELLGDPALSVGLLADALATDAFELDGVFQNIRFRAADPSARGVPVRLLLGQLPRSNGAAEEALLAAKLRRLMEDGVRVRLAGNDVLPRITASRWHVVGCKADERYALGGVWANGKQGTAATRFGAAWLDGGIPVEAEGGEARAAVETFEALWDASTDVALKDLEPTTIERVAIVSVKQGSQAPADCSPRLLLDRTLATEGGLASVGHVTRLIYVDRYVARSTIALYCLKELLSAFTYAPLATARILSWLPDPDSSGPLPADVILAKRIFKLSQGSSKSLQEWCTNQVAAKVKLAFHVKQDLPHPRKLLVEFAPGGNLKTLKVCFDQGLDWMRTGSPRGPAVLGPFIAGETHVVVLRDQPLDRENGWQP